MRAIILTTISYMINKEFSTKSKHRREVGSRDDACSLCWYQSNSWNLVCFLKKIAPPVAEDAGRKLGDLHHQ
uniref:Uncharacterized protein n=1 Tax=Solanum tuberosum TaxID=4113 RepID=M1D479_SOLTU